MKTKKQSAKKTKTLVTKKVEPKTKKVLLARKTPKVVVKKVVARAVKKTKTMAATKRIDSIEKVSHKKESTLKRFCYMTLAVILGLLMGTFVHLFLELAYFKEIIKRGLTPEVNNFLGIYSFLPIPAVLLSLLAGLVFGIWLGSWGWRMVYIERRHRMFRKA